MTNLNPFYSSFITMVQRKRPGTTDTLQQLPCYLLISKGTNSTAIPRVGAVADSQMAIKKITGPIFMTTQGRWWLEQSEHVYTWKKSHVSEVIWCLTNVHQILYSEFIQQWHFLSLWHFVHVKTITSLLPRYVSSSLTQVAQILVCCAYDDSVP